MFTVVCTRWTHALIFFQTIQKGWRLAQEIEFDIFTARSCLIQCIIVNVGNVNSHAFMDFLLIQR